MTTKTMTEYESRTLKGSLDAILRFHTNFGSPSEYLRANDPHLKVAREMEGYYIAVDHLLCFLSQNPPKNWTVSLTKAVDLAYAVASNINAGE